MNTDLSSILAVCASVGDPLTMQRARAFAQTHHLEFILDDTLKPDVKSSAASGPNILAPKGSPGVSTFPYILYYQGRFTSIIQTEKGAPGPVTASFIGGKVAHRRQFGGGKGQMIAKAVGLGGGVTPEVLDASAGLGRDAFVLASLGCKVTLLERSPVIAELLASALAEAEGTEVDDVVARMSLHQTNAVQWLDLQTSVVADVIYLDPMYPQREKSSLVKKEMRLFKVLVGDDADDAELLSAALEKARYRVVVKRPRKGQSIAGPAPSYQLMGKSCRYDIYSIKSLAGLKST